MDKRQWEQSLGADRFRYEEPPRRNWFGLIKLLIVAIVLVAAIGGAVWYFLIDEKPHDIKNLPVVEADKEPAKIMPENVGKVDVPHQDKLFYNQVSSSKGKPVVEHLLSPPEEPLPIGDEHVEVQPAQPVVQNPATTVVPAKSEPTNEDVVELKEVEHPSLDEIPVPPKALKVEEKPKELVAKEEPEKKAEPEKKKPEPAKPDSKPKFGVQIASAVSVAAAKKEWSLITRKAITLFEGQPVTYPKINREGKKGFLYRVQIGAFAEKAEAQKLCDKMAAQKIKCRVVPYKK